MSELALLSLLLVAVGAEGCPACLAARQHLRQISITQIKEQILDKLGLSQAPNITGRPIPRIPLLDQFYEKMQADQAAVDDDSDDNIATLEKAITFAQPRTRQKKDGQPEEDPCELAAILRRNINSEQTSRKAAIIKISQ